MCKPLVGRVVLRQLSKQGQCPGKGRSSRERVAQTQGLGRDLLSTLAKRTCVSVSGGPRRSMGCSRGVWASVTSGLCARVSGCRHALFWACPSEPVVPAPAMAALSYPVCSLLHPRQTPDISMVLPCGPAIVPGARSHPRGGHPF